MTKPKNVSAVVCLPLKFSKTSSSSELSAIVVNGVGVKAVVMDVDFACVEINDDVDSIRALASSSSSCSK